MLTPITPNEMRRLVLDGFQQHCEERISGGDLEERVRIEEGRVVAYCYRVADVFAMWMVQVGLVQFYDGQGNMLQTLDMMAPQVSERRAA